MVSVIVYRVLVSIPMFRSKSFKGLASIIASSSGAFVNLLFIMILGKVYERLALRLTQWGTCMGAATLLIIQAYQQ